MKQRAGLPSRFGPSLKALIQRFAFLLLLAAAFGLMVLGKADTVLVERARVAVTDALTPILALLSRPAAGLAAAIDEARRLAAIHGENARLREEQARLLQWQAVARRLEAENRALRNLANLAPNPGQRFITARVVGDLGGAFVRSVLVAAGQREGVRKGQAVVTAEGLAGRVFEVGQRSARIILLTDINSRVPVVIERTRDRAVLAGNNSDRLRLLYLPVEAAPAPGDRVVTSGHGGVFVPGLPVGVVTAVADGVVEVQPLVDWGRMEYVRVIDYELPGILLSADPDRDAKDTP